MLTWRIWWAPNNAAKGRLDLTWPLKDSSRRYIYIYIKGQENHLAQMKVVVTVINSVMVSVVVLWNKLYYVTGWTTRKSRFESWQGKHFICLYQVSSPTVGSIQPPLQGIPGAVPSGLKRLECEANHYISKQCRGWGWVQLCPYVPYSLRAFATFR